jgi:hypothetical protein
MTQADRVLSTPPANTPIDTTRRFETLKDAEDALMKQGFKLVPHTCNWIDDAARSTLAGGALKTLNDRLTIPAHRLRDLP